MRKLLNNDLEDICFLEKVVLPYYYLAGIHFQMWSFPKYFVELVYNFIEGQIE